MKNIFRRILFGNTAIKEYSTITIPGEIREKVFLEVGRTLIDISQNQWLLCLEPVVFGVWLTDKEPITAINKKKECRLSFTDPAGGKGKGRNLAVATVIFFDKIEDDQGTLFLLKLEKSRLFHTGFFKILVLFYRYYKKPTFTFDKFKSFVSAYSYPRKVNIISFRQGDYYNIFPMDLTGEPGQAGRFVFGLRHSNLALAKIIENKRLVKSDVSYEYKDIIYQLGKHHGTNPPPLDALPFRVIESEQFRFYIPSWADKYKEIEIVKTLNLGSHMLLWGKLINAKILKNPTGHLFHIHFLLYFYHLRKGVSYPLA
jgi:hypothetical protein